MKKYKAENGIYTIFLAKNEVIFDWMEFFSFEEAKKFAEQGYGWKGMSASIQFSKNGCDGLRVCMDCGGAKGSRRRPKYGNNGLMGILRRLNDHGGQKSNKRDY